MVAVILRQQNVNEDLVVLVLLYKAIVYGESLNHFIRKSHAGLYTLTVCASQVL